MRARWTARLRMPSPAMLVAVIALVAALGGTAYAATTTIVNIADPTNSANKAKVTSAGALKTAVTGDVGPAIPANPFLGYVSLPEAGLQPVIAANHATVALTRLVFSNLFDQEQGAPAEVIVEQLSGTASSCDGSTGGAVIGRYEVAAGGTVTDEMTSPIVLAPLVKGDVWCLDEQADSSLPPEDFVSLAVGVSGYVASGTLPDGAVATTSPHSAALRVGHAARAVR